MPYIIIPVVIIVLLALFIVAQYNSLVVLRNKVKDQWAQIDVLLKRRFDLIPNLIETVKGYAKHESETLEAVITARNKAVNATTKEEEIANNQEVTSALNKLFALAENYPDLKANASFIDLQNNLKDTEDKIAYARQFYNDAVLIYKNKIEVFPSNIIASMFNFKPEAFFEANATEKENVQVKF